MFNLNLYITVIPNVNNKSGCVFIIEQGWKHFRLWELGRVTSEEALFKFIENYNKYNNKELGNVQK